MPNPPAEDTPDGATEEDAVVVKLVGEPPVFSFEPRDHLELAAAHGWIDVERAARVSGSRFVYRVGDVALLEIALYRWALARIVQKGHVPMLPPVLVRDEAMYGTGFFPSEKGDFYEVPEDGLYLVGTSEVPLAAFHMGEEVDGLPLRYVALSTCFRREAGAAGRDTRGMFRVHQFDKVEMFVFCEPERSRDEHERLLAIEEELVQELELPYRVLNIAAGDLGSSAAKKYDIEAWFPGQSRYREITSTSNTTDYQARRLTFASAATEARARAHAERDGGDGARDDRDPRELPGRRRLGLRPGAAPGVRGAGAARGGSGRHPLLSGPDQRHRKRRRVVADRVRGQIAPVLADSDLDDVAGVEPVQRRDGLPRLAGRRTLVDRDRVVVHVDVDSAVDPARLVRLDRPRHVGRDQVDAGHRRGQVCRAARIEQVAGVEADRVERQPLNRRAGDLDARVLVRRAVDAGRDRGQDGRREAAVVECARA